MGQKRQKQEGQFRERGHEKRDIGDKEFFNPTSLVFHIIEYES